MKSSVKKGMVKIVALACTGLLPAIGFCQPPGPGDGADVPFDSNMNLIFLAIGLVFAAVVIFRRLRKKAVTKV